MEDEYNPISESDQFFLRCNYNGLLRLTDTALLMKALETKETAFSRDVLSYITNPNKSADKKFEYIFFSVLLDAGTYKHLKVFCETLGETGQTDALKFLSKYVEGKDDQSSDSNNGSDGEDEVDGCVMKNNDTRKDNGEQNIFRPPTFRPPTHKDSNSEEEIVRAASNPTHKGSDSDEEILRAAARPTVYNSDSDEEIYRPATKSTLNTASRLPEITVTQNCNTDQTQNIPNTTPEQPLKRNRSTNSFSESVKSATKPLRKLVGKFSTMVKRTPSQNTKKTKPSTSASSPDLTDGLNVEFISEEESQTLQYSPKTPTIRRLDSFTDAFIHYETKDPDKPYGKGLCLIAALFTEDLTGYKKDCERLSKFFKSLGYDILTTQNVTRKELFSKLRETQDHLAAQGDYDRLVVVVLTHGLKDGLMTCQDSDGFLEETRQYTDENGIKQEEKVFTKVDEIVDCFKHDKNNVPSLKGMPKLFLIQACRGQNLVKAANSPNIGKHDIDDDNGKYLPFKLSSPIDGDIAVCFATTDDHPSMVNPTTGSWFIQKTVDVFSKHLRDQHVIDMMTVVNLAVAELRGKLDDDNGKKSMALQMPCILSSFRRKFYLTNPYVSYTMRQTKSLGSELNTFRGSPGNVFQYNNEL